MTARTTSSGRARHLIGRFFGHITAASLTPSEQLFINARLGVGGAGLFWRQSVPDQRHAYRVAARVAAQRPEDDQAIVAALLHDVGKRHSALGAARRSIATVLDTAGLPMPATMRQYRRHGPIGADDLAARGYDGLVVAFARFHPGKAPSGVDQERWQALLDADG